MSDARKEELRALVREYGFAECRVSAAVRADHAEEYHEWLEKGMHGTMGWMERNVEMRSDPRELLPGAKSVICLAMNYYPGEAAFGEGDVGGYRIARYAWNEDYHELIWKKLRELDLRLQEWGGVQRTFTDSGPVLERDFASRAGLGWNGKSTVQIHRRLGTWFFLAEVVTTLEFAPDERQSSHCGSCRKCIEGCPTGAIVAPHVLDARKCLSYLTIEHKGAIPVEYRRLMGDRIYGCDQCLEVCPWNRFAEVSGEIRFWARREIFEHSLVDFLAMGEEDFRRVFAGSPIKRIKRERFLRNVCVALGNVGSAADLPALERAMREESELIREHAAWAIGEIGRETLKVES